MNKTQIVGKYLLCSDYAYEKSLFKYLKKHGNDSSVSYKRSFRMNETKQKDLQFEVSRA